MRKLSLLENAKSRKHSILLIPLYCLFCPCFVIAGNPHILLKEHSFKEKMSKIYSTKYNFSNKVCGLEGHGIDKESLRIKARQLNLGKIRERQFFRINEGI